MKVPAEVCISDARESDTTPRQGVLNSPCDLTPSSDTHQHLPPWSLPVTTEMERVMGFGGGSTIGAPQFMGGGRPVRLKSTLPGCPQGR